MVMAMLRAGGVPTIGHDHSGELEGPDAIARLAREDVEGRAVKFLDHLIHYPIPKADWRFVWLDRRSREQAKSQVKMLRWLGQDIRDGMDEKWTMDALVEANSRDRAMLLGRLRQIGPVLELDYERVIAQPPKAAKALARLWPDLDRVAAAAAVHDRDPACLPDMAFEETGG